MLHSKLYAWLHRQAHWAHKIWPGRIRDPIFIVGCPRSGTSILGRMLAQQPGLLYLNEPRSIWCQVRPELDVYGWRYPISQGTLCLDAADLDASEARQLSHWFHLQMFTSPCHRLIEKTPSNVFRMRWLHAMFPDAKFVHLIRHGRDVALSLTEALRGWYPPLYWECSWHYGLFRAYAARHRDLWEKLEHIAENMGNYPRGLFVWLCSVTEGRGANTELGRTKYLELRYEDLILRPEQELSRLYDFISEPLHQSVLDYVRKALRPHSVGKRDPAPHLTRVIAGDLLRELDYGVG